MLARCCCAPLRYMLVQQVGAVCRSGSAGGLLSSALHRAEAAGLLHTRGGCPPWLRLAPQVADEHGLETGGLMAAAPAAKVAAPAGKVAAPDQDLTQRLAELRGGK